MVDELLHNLHIAADHKLYLIYLTDPRLNLRIIDRYYLDLYESLYRCE